MLEHELGGWRVWQGKPNGLLAPKGRRCRGRQRAGAEVAGLFGKRQRGWWELWKDGSGERRTVMQEGIRFVSFVIVFFSHF
jgi:hypothetical protein